MQPQPDKLAILSGILTIFDTTKTVSNLTQQEVEPLFAKHNPDHVTAIRHCLQSLDHCAVQLLVLASLGGLDYNLTNLHPHVMALIIRHWCNTADYMLGIVFVELHVEKPKKS